MPTAVSAPARSRPARVSGAASSSPAVSTIRTLAAAQQRLGLLAVAGHPGRVGDQRRAPPDQPVEQGRFADIGPAGDDDGGEHDAVLQATAPISHRGPSGGRQIGLGTSLVT